MRRGAPPSAAPSDTASFGKSPMPLLPLSFLSDGPAIPRCSARSGQHGAKRCSQPIYVLFRRRGSQGADAPDAAFESPQPAADLDAMLAKQPLTDGRFVHAGRQLEHADHGQAMLLLAV